MKPDEAKERSSVSRSRGRSQSVHKRRKRRHRRSRRSGTRSRSRRRRARTDEASGLPYDPKVTKPAEPNTPPTGRVGTGEASGSQGSAREPKTAPPQGGSRGQPLHQFAKGTVASDPGIPAAPVKHQYRYGATNVKPELWDDRPRALIMFSGRSRSGDLASYLHANGWIVVLIDTVVLFPANLLDDAVWKLVTNDILAEIYDALWIATPCETFSPLRENPPGPRPLRSLELPMGLPEKDLTQVEVKQLMEANILLDRSTTAFKQGRRLDLGVGMENPDHGEKLDVWKTPVIRRLLEDSSIKTVHFDQCRFGAETTKPTTLASYKLDLAQVNNLRCDHPLKDFTSPKGLVYRAAHESLVQRWRVSPSGTKERASRALGEYPPRLNRLLAESMGKIDRPRVQRLARLRAEPIP